MCTNQQTDPSIDQPHPHSPTILHHSRSDGTDIGAVVADIGAHTAKLGFAGEDIPRALFSSVRLVYRLG